MRTWFEKLIRKYYKNLGFVNVLTKSDNVSDLKIENNTVSAKILGGDSPQHCEIRFKKFSEDEKARLNEIVKKPVVSYKLSNNVFPVELLDSGVNIFPESPDDFSVKCSCGEEFGVCGDVIYLLQVLSRLMDENQVLILMLRGFDFKKREFVHIKFIDEIFSHNFRDKDFDSADLNDVNSVFLRDIGSSSLSLDAIYTVVFKLLNDELTKILGNPNYREYIKFKHFKSPNFHRKDLIELFEKKWGNPENISFNIDSDYEMSHLGYIKNPKFLFAYLMEMSQFLDVTTFDYNIFYFLDLLILTFSLLKKGAIVPQIFKLDNFNYTIRWIPAFYKGDILEECRQYYNGCPDDLITYNRRKISRENQVIIAVSLIMKGFIDYYIERYGAFKFKSYFTEPMYQLFFGEPLEMSTSGELINSVAQKISVFEMDETNFHYHMVLDDSDEGMYLELKIDNGDELKSLEDADWEELRFVKNIYDLFAEFGIDNRLCERIFLDYDDYRMFKYHIEPLFKYLNVNYEMLFEVQDVKLKLKLDLTMGDESFNFNNLKNYEWKVLVGDDTISIDEFNRIYKHLDSLVKINGNYYSVDKHRLNVFQGNIFFLPTNLETNELLQISLMERYRNLKFESDSKLKELTECSRIVGDIDGLNAKLRHYQKIGVSWLLQNINAGFGSILADDMGLGKTIQVLACILHLKKTGKLNNQSVLIIAPTTLLANWQQEIIKFTPSLTYSLYHGNNRNLSDDVDIVLTSFGMIRTDFETFSDKSWFLCVVDEAQNIKNPNTLQTKAIKQINAFNRIALTGTPIENKLLDYWSIFDFTNEGYLGSRTKFKKDFVAPIEKNSSGKSLNNLKKITKPFVLRRLKSDEEIISDLPEKNVNDIYCQLSDKQIGLYRDIMDGILKDLKGLKGINRKGKILKLITYLKQVCNHPSQYLKSDKINADDSGKLALLMEILDNIMEMDEKVIIFTQYVEMGEILEKVILEKFKCNTLFLHGSCSMKSREGIIDKFQNNSDYPILISTLKTGGVGLNLTSAQNVIHYDLWWNPAVENQATDRVYRIGQKKDVMVYRLITKGTLEENIDLMIKNKLELAGMAIDSEETFITEMSDDELKEMLALR